MLYKNGKLDKVQEILLVKDKEVPVDTVNIVQLTDQIPQGSFDFSKPVKVYAAGQGDINELLGNKVQVEELGGTKK